MEELNCNIKQIINSRLNQQITWKLSVKDLAFFTVSRKAFIKGLCFTTPSTKPTPNPSSLKFHPGKDVMPTPDQTMDFSSIRFTHISPLARRLFQVDGIVRVFYGKDYISVTKKEDLDWNVLKPEVLEVITDHYSKSQPLFTEELPADDTQINDDDPECVALIKEIIETRIRPFVQEDGGDVKYIDFDEDKGHVRLQMKGSCAGCPSSAVTLKNGIENMLKHYVAEVETVEAVDELLD